MTLTVEATPAEVNAYLAPAIEALVEKFPAAKILKGAALQTEHIDFSMRLPQIGDATVRVQVNTDAQG